MTDHTMRDATEYGRESMWRDTAAVDTERARELVTRLVADRHDPRRPPSARPRM